MYQETIRVIVMPGLEESSVRISMSVQSKTTVMKMQSVQTTSEAMSAVAKKGTMETESHATKVLVTICRVQRIKNVRNQQLFSVNVNQALKR